MYQRSVSVHVLSPVSLYKLPPMVTGHTATFSSVAQVSLFLADEEMGGSKDTKVQMYQTLMMQFAQTINNPVCHIYHFCLLYHILPPLNPQPCAASHASLVLKPTPFPTYPIHTSEPFATCPIHIPHPGPPGSSSCGRHPWFWLPCLALQGAVRTERSCPIGAALC